MLTAEDVYNLIVTKYGNLEEFAEYIDYKATIPLNDGAFAVKMDSHFGGQGHDGDVIFIVFKVWDQFYKLSGYYSSWDGREWDDHIVEVEQKIKQIVVYKDKK